jgi:hypothetical protein
MTQTAARLVLEVTAADRITLDRQLDHAEFLAQQAAMKDRTGGVLITRHSPDRFTVAVSESVPFGVTRELSSW